jgi:hypothetical protein
MSAIGVIVPAVTQTVLDTGWISGVQLISVGSVGGHFTSARLPECSIVNDQSCWQISSPTALTILQPDLVIALNGLQCKSTSGLNHYPCQCTSCGAFDFELKVALYTP